MHCSKCAKQAVFQDPTLCKQHFFSYFEKKVKDTIKQFSLLKKSDNVVVAVSGGKDSLTVLYLLQKFGYDVTALAIDEGIENYRDNTLEDMKKFCNEHNIVFKIVAFKKETGKTLDQVPIEGSRCTYCGTIRRTLLNKYAKGFDKIATGHNADDESQAVLMNFFKAQTSLLHRAGPISEKKKGFVQKIKPLYFCTEKEIMAFSFLKGIQTNFVECPYAHFSYRGLVRDILNKETSAAKRKQQLLKSSIAIAHHLEQKETASFLCIKCKSPTKNEQVCKACSLAEEQV